MTKIVYNDCFGGFGLSEAAIARYTEIQGTPPDRDVDRADPALVQVVEELGKAANGRHASLKIADVPSGTQYRIDEYDGAESVETKETYDWKTA